LESSSCPGYQPEHPAVFLNMTTILLPTASYFIWISSASLLCITLVVLYRLLLHPLASIPGPNIAAATALYEFYYDCILGGKFSFKIDDLHKQYGKQIVI
jgi:hypothetical protein